MNAEDPLEKLLKTTHYDGKSLLSVQDPVLHGAWQLARQGSRDVYESAAGLYTLVFYYGIEYEHYGRLRVPRLTRRFRKVQLYVGREWEATRSYTLYDRGVIGESLKSSTRLESLTRSIEAAADRLFGITNIKWNRY